LKEDEELAFVFVPHIFKDLKAISEVLEKIQDEYRRKRVTVAPYLNGVQAHDQIFDIYKKANLVIGMRFHTNVCSIAFNSITIPLATQHFKVGDLYQELGLEDRIVDISKKGFEMHVKQMIVDSLCKEKEIKEIYKCVNDDLLNKMKAYCYDVNKWLKRYY
jgi:polysaccharide pyruvyl transferase WcaK-like protein